MESDLAIAVIGMAGRFPGANDVAQLWTNLAAGVESITRFEDDELLAAGVAAELLRDPRYVKARGVLDGLDGFDHQLFGLTALEATSLAPQHRAFLECCWAALDDAGCDPRRSAARIGVFAGARRGEAPTSVRSASPIQAMQSRIASDSDFITTLASYSLDLRGPSIGVQTACSTGLVAVHLACQSLLVGDCDVALAGAVSIALPQTAGYLFEPGGIASSDGHCRPFAADASGTVTGSGVGVVVLKPLDRALAEGDAVRAVILGSAVNNDGRHKVGFAAPSVAGQVAVVRAALAQAGVDPRTITMLEAHGTGTPLGDPVEVAALADVFAGGTRAWCALGSVKSNLGHLDAAAGVAGLIKAVLALEHGEIPPSLHCEPANPALDLDRSPFFLARELRPWRGEGARRAGVSSFGVGGTNAHVVLEQSPRLAPAPPTRGSELLRLSAYSEGALAATVARLAAALQEGSHSLPQVAETLRTGRAQLPWRAALVAHDTASAVRALRDGALHRGHAAEQPQLALLFGGQGALRPAIDAAWYTAAPRFARELDQCCTALRAWLDVDVRAVLLADCVDLDADALFARTAVAQPMLFALQWSLFCHWHETLAAPAALLGHSLGELVAACAAGVFARDDALWLATERGRLMQECAPGAMLAVHLAERDLAPHLDTRLDLAAVNGPALCVVAGDTAAVADLRQRLRRERVACQELGASHAFHSRAMDAAADAFAAAVARVKRRAPQYPLASSCAGGWLAPDLAIDPAWWGQQLRAPVRFWPALGGLVERCNAALELSGSRALLHHAAEHPAYPDKLSLAAAAAPGRRGQLHRAAELEARAALWCSGLEVDRAPRDPALGCARLPSYPFRHPAPPAPAPTALPRTRPALHTDTERAVANLWEEVLGTPVAGPEANFFADGGNSLRAFTLIARVEQALQRELPLRVVFDTPTLGAIAAHLSGAADPPPRAKVAPAATTVPAAHATGNGANRAMAFSLFFFSADGSTTAHDKYDLLLRCARLADQRGLAAVWVPERHFEDFGGLYPNPAQLGAVLAAVTARIQIRAGSVVLPLHHPARLAEEWAVADNLSGGRVAISVATGWHPRDFVLGSGAHAERREDALANLRALRTLWAGTPMTFRAADGSEHEVRVRPRPIQPELPIWLSIAGNPRTWALAGELGTNVLTGMVNQPLDELAAKIEVFRAAARRAGHDPDAKIVTVMLHTFLGGDDDEVRALVRAPMREYLRAFLAQHESIVARERPQERAVMSQSNVDELLDRAFERTFNTSSLLGSVDRAQQLIAQLQAIGVGEVACLVDFGLPSGTVLAGLDHLDELRRRVSR